MKAIIVLFLCFIYSLNFCASGNETVTIAIIAHNRPHVLPLFLAALENQSWPKDQTNIYVKTYDNTDQTADLLRLWTNRVKDQYREVYFDESQLGASTYASLMEQAVLWAKEHASHCMMTEACAFLLPQTIEKLVMTGFAIVAPLLRTGGTLYSNYHACVDKNGYYKDCPLYQMLLGVDIQGIVKVPVVNTSYLIRHEVLADMVYHDTTARDAYVVFSDNARKKGIAQYLDTREIYGRILYPATGSLEGVSWLCDFEALSSSVQEINDRLAPLFKKEEPELLEKSHFSQYGQDKWLDEYVFKGKRDGMFVDVGAYGIEGSNTYFFEKERGWKGLCIEPQPDLYKKLANLRSVECVNACITKEPGEVTFLHIQSPAARQLSGIIDQYDERHLDMINRAIAAHGGKKELIKVPGVPLAQLLAERAIDHVDYLSVDVEGAEMLVLQSINFEAVEIDVISVEVNYSWPELEAFLKSKGFEFVTKVGMDQIWQNKNCSNK